MTVALLAVLAIATALFIALRRRSPGQLAQGFSAPPAAGSGPRSPIGPEVSF